VEIRRWDEQELIRRCKQGSEAAYAELVFRHRPRLYTLAYRMIGDRESAEDVVQETFVAAFRAIDRFEPRPSLSAWLNTILLRLAGKAAIKADARPGASLDAMIDADHESIGVIAGAALASSPDDPHAAAEAAELRAELSAAIAALPFRYRAAVVTRFILGLDYAEAAASLEMGLNTYKSHLLRGTRMLRETLTESNAARSADVADAADTAAPVAPASAIPTPTISSAVSAAPTPELAIARQAQPQRPVVRASGGDRSTKTEFRQPAVEGAGASSAIAGSAATYQKRPE
jgi:RNA polymerase sigma-70 factor, ECF subfamily